MHRSHRAALAVLLGLVSVPLASVRAQSANPVVLRREIDSLHAAMIAAYKRDPASVANYYTDDARIIGMGAHISGRDSVLKYWGQSAGPTDWQLEILEVGGTTDAPWLLGRSTLLGAGGRHQTTDYLAILARGKDGHLRYRIDLYTPADAPTMRRP